MKPALLKKSNGFFYGGAVAHIVIAKADIRAIVGGEGAQGLGDFIGIVQTGQPGIQQIAGDENKIGLQSVDLLA